MHVWGSPINSLKNKKSLILIIKMLYISDLFLPSSSKHTLQGGQNFTFSKMRLNYLGAMPHSFIIGGGRGAVAVTPFAQPYPNSRQTFNYCFLLFIKPPAPIDLKYIILKLLIREPTCMQYLRVSQNYIFIQLCEYMYFIKPPLNLLMHVWGQCCLVF